MGRRVLSVRVDEELYEALQRRAREEGLSLTRLVERLLRQGLGMRESRLESLELTLLGLIDAVEELAGEVERCCGGASGVRAELGRLRRGLQQA